MIFFTMLAISAGCGKLNLHAVQPFSARCEDSSNNIIFILVSDPTTNGLYFSRADGQGNASRISNLDVSNEEISGEEDYAFEKFKKSGTTAALNLRSGEFVHRYYTHTDIGVVERHYEERCVFSPPQSHDSDLRQVMSRVNSELGGG